MKWVCKFENDELHLEGISLNDSGAEIYIHDDGTFSLFEIPLYGGTPMFVKNYTNINEAIKVAESWT
jgi:hypothetical protein